MITSQKQGKNKTHNGTLRTPVTFYACGVANGLDARENVMSVKYEAFAECYAPSSKDIEILKNSSVSPKRSLTIKIREPMADYRPGNKHRVKVRDARFADIFWDIADIRPDLTQNEFITILLKGD
ncbi:hypothetical protein RsY01_910 [Lactococcus reticulitermitis]|uniref:Phage head-tail adapter protein n=2 Tax=Pseudolactococcus reticulitermitis TaxID=2025039 RepID=A0A224XCF7_9LACT|nr:hypothetical protein RsY01_910 [Lactococcus reticulitermitis]